MRKKSKSPLKKLENKLWKECRRIILTKYQDKIGSYGWKCFTCGAKHLVGTNCQLGHFIPKGSCGEYLKYDLRNLRIQCYHCNINLGGNGAEFYRKLVSEKGKRYVDKIFKDKQRSIKAIDYYIELLAKYEKM